MKIKGLQKFLLITVMLLGLVGCNFNAFILSNLDAVRVDRFSILKLNLVNMIKFHKGKK